MTGTKGLRAEQVAPRVALVRGFPGLNSLREMGRRGVEIFLLEGVGRWLEGGSGSGDLLLLEDHLNLTGGNPLVGPNADDFGPRFPDMSEVYDPALREVARSAALKTGTPLRGGIFAEVAGDGFRDLLDSALIRKAGANMAGTGIVPSAIVVRHMGRRVLALASPRTNEDAGASTAPLIHEIVKEL